MEIAALMGVAIGALITGPYARPAASRHLSVTVIQTGRIDRVNAVRLSDVPFIAALSSGVTACVSPMARPDSRPPPLPGSADAAAAKPARSPLAQSRYRGAPPTIVVGPEGKTRKATPSAGSVAARVPERAIVLPMPTVAD